MSNRKVDERAAAPAKWRAAFLLTALLGCAMFAAGCASVISSEQEPAAPVRAAQPAPQPTPRVLINAQSSPEAVARHFLKALAARDLTTMRSLRITKDEFCQLIFPQLPSSKIPNLSCDFAWDQATLKSEGGLYDLLPRYAGKRYEMISLRFAKGTDSYHGYKVHKETHLIVKDERGEKRELRLFGSMLELDGQFKLFSFVID